MSYRIKHKKKEELLNFIRDLKLNIVTKEQMPDLCIVPTIEKIDDFNYMHYKYAIGIIDIKEKRLLINDYQNLDFINKLNFLVKQFLVELKTNIKYTTKKKIAIEYLREIQFSFNSLYNNFIYENAPNSEIDFPQLNYRFSCPAGLRLWDVLYDLRFLLDFLKNFVKYIVDKIESIKIRTLETPDNQFQNPMNVNVLALYYYFMIKAGALTSFSNYPNMTTEKAMEHVLKKDGYEYTSHFRNAFYAIGTGNRLDPINKKILMH